MYVFKLLFMNHLLAYIHSFDASPITIHAIKYHSLCIVSHSPPSTVCAVSSPCAQHIALTLSLSYNSRVQKFYTLIPSVSVEIVISVQYPLFIALIVLLHNAELSNLVVTPLSAHKSLVLIKLIVESLVIKNLAY